MIWCSLEEELREESREERKKRLQREYFHAQKDRVDYEEWRRLRNASATKWQRDHPDEVYCNNLKWRKANPEKVKARLRRSWARNKDDANRRRREKYHANLEESRKKNREAYHRKMERKRVLAMEKQGGVGEHSALWLEKEAEKALLEDEELQARLREEKRVAEEKNSQFVLLRSRWIHANTTKIHTTEYDEFIVGLKKELGIE